jgi:hypothetical protein
MMAEKSHPFPFPDPASFDPVFPDAPPWESPIWRLSAWWLDIYCDCGHHVAYPLRLLSAERGWDVKLRDVVERATCSKCGRRPERIDLVERIGSQQVAGKPSRWKRLPLTPVSPAL